MGHISKRQPTGKLAPTEGLLHFSFVFDGKVYRKSHTLSEFEVKHMKDLLKEHGDVAADQVVWKMAIKCAGILGENIVAHAAQGYMKAHEIPAEGKGAENKEKSVFDSPETGKELN